MAQSEDVSDVEPVLPTAVVVDSPPDDPTDPLRWARRAIFVGVLLLGWVFIAWANRFYWTAPMVMLCLGYLAVVSTVYALWRTGVTAVSEEEEGADSTWGRPVGARGELDREKRTLLKAIKEAEFDREMGKLSKKDADEMIAVYRLRAIEVIKELDRLGDEAGPELTTRQRIEREVKARLELDKNTTKGSKKTKKAPKAVEAKDAEPVVDEAPEIPEGHDSTVAAEAETPEAKEATP